MTLHIYWLPAQTFQALGNALHPMGLRLRGSKMTPCETLRAGGDTVVYATPQVFSRMCKRQGSWYRDSVRNGQFLVLSPRRLPAPFAEHLDAEIAPTDVRPDRMPTTQEILDLVEDPAYVDGRPGDWEKKTKFDAVMFKIFFTVTRAWGRGDTLKKHWLTHRANHANFVAERFTTQIDGEAVPHSISGVEGVCSSCVEFFNITNTARRKLVRACPGSVVFGSAPRDKFMDVRPLRDAA